LATLTVLCTMPAGVSTHEIGGLTFEVEDNDHFCFFERFLNKTVYIVEYQVRTVANCIVQEALTFSVNVHIHLTLGLSTEPKQK